MDKLIPILKPAGYAQNKPLFFKEPLFPSNISPIIAFGNDEGNTISYQPAKDEKELQEKFPLVKETALANLEALEVNYQVTDFDGTKIVIAEGHEYACEKILDKVFMQKIATELQSDSLMVGIPFKGVLIAIDSNSPMRLKLPAVIKQYYDNPQQDRISDKVFLFQNGLVAAIGGENLPDDENKGNISILESSDQNYTISLNSSNIEDLTKDLNSSFQQVLMMIMQRKSFGGQITFELSDDISLNQTLIDKCNSYVEQVEKNEMLQIVAKVTANNKISFRFLHNGVLIAPSSASEEFEEKVDKKWWEFWK